eukprot:225566-Pelagomonas_calceolata.AAC.2
MIALNWTLFMNEVASTFYLLLLQGLRLLAGLKSSIILQTVHGAWCSALHLPLPGVSGTEMGKVLKMLVLHQHAETQWQSCELPNKNGATCCLKTICLQKSSSKCGGVCCALLPTGPLLLWQHFAASALVGVSPILLAGTHHLCAEFRTPGLHNSGLPQQLGVP